MPTTKHTKVKVPISPMIDIIFLMIFFFVVSSTMDQGINEAIKLVKVENLKPGNLPSNKVFISVKENGDILLENGTLVPSNQLKSYTSNIIKSWGKSTKFIIRADKDMYHRDLNITLQQLKKSGARNIVLSGEKLN